MNRLKKNDLGELDIKLTELIRSMVSERDYDREDVEEAIVRLINQYQHYRSKAE